MLKQLALWRGEAKRPHSSIVSEEATTWIPVRNSLIAKTREMRKSGDLSSAMAKIMESLSSHPCDPELLFALGSTCYEWKRYRDADHYLREAGKYGIDHWVRHIQQGWCAYFRGDLTDARELMRLACAAGPGEWQPLYGAASVEMAMEDWPAARALLEQVRACDADNVASLSNLAMVLGKLDLLSEADTTAHEALRIDPQCVAALTPLGISLSKQLRNDDALEIFKEAQAVDVALGIDSGAAQNLINVYIELGRSSDAVVIAEEYLPRSPRAGTYANFAVALIAVGRLEEGWPLYEYRWMNEPLVSARGDFSLPVWHGQDIAGKAVLVRTEQGIGDFIQFIRYAKLLKALGATVHVQARADTAALSRCFPGVDKVLSGGADTSEYSYYINLMSLPAVFGTGDATIPREFPYTSVGPERIGHWRDKLSAMNGLKVGLVWGGNPKHLRDRQRSIALAKLEPLLSVPGVNFISLQHGKPTEQIATSAFNGAISDFSSELSEYPDTVALIHNLDLVIGVDTSVIHAAGAAGVPVWTLIAKCADYRWKDSGEATPWYPSMRLFRQRDLGDWEPVIDQMALALADAARADPIPATHHHKSPDEQSLPLAVPAFRPHGGIDTKWCPVIEAREGMFQYRVDEDDDVSKSLGWYGEYNHHEVRILARLLRRGQRVIEAGSGFGIHTLAMGRLVGPPGEIMVYEQDNILKHILRQNLETNKIRNATIMLRSLKTREGPSDFSVETIDELQLRSLDWIKIPSTVNLAALVAGPGQSFWRLRPKVMVAFDSVEAAHAFARQMQEFGYASWVHETTLFNPGNFFNIPQDVFDGRRTASLIAIPEEVEVDVPMEPYVRVVN